VLQSPVVDPHWSPQTLGEVLAAFSEVNRALEGEINEIQKDAEIKSLATSLSGELQTHALEYVKQWSDAVNRTTDPRISNWGQVADIKRPVANVQAELAQTLERATVAYRVVTSNKAVVPKAAEAGEAALRRLGNVEKAPDVAILANKLFASLDERSPALSRERLLASAAGFDEVLSAISKDQPTTASQMFWHRLSSACLTRLIADVRPEGAKILGDLRGQTADTVPLCGGGRKVWEPAKLPLKSVLKPVNDFWPDGSATLTQDLAKQVRDLGLITPEWAVQIGWLRALDRYMDSGGPVELEITKPIQDNRRRGKWQAVQVTQGGTAIDATTGQDSTWSATLAGRQGLRDPISFTLLRSPDGGGGKAADVLDNQFERPWGLLRLCISAQRQQPVELKIRDDNGETTILLSVRKGGMPKVAIPATVPGVPN
jgi:hypothetical protein